jgi:hypothetical protein
MKSNLTANNKTDSMLKLPEERHIPKTPSNLPSDLAPNTRISHPTIPNNTLHSSPHDPPKSQPRLPVHNLTHQPKLPTIVAHRMPIFTGAHLTPQPYYP